MTRVCIYVDYCRNDTTLAALQVADWLLKIGVDVVFVTPNRVTRGIHPYWDNKVYTVNNGTTIPKKLANVDYVFWFTLDFLVYTTVLPLVLEYTKTKEPKNIIFPCWQKESCALDTMFSIADRIVFLSEDNFYWSELKRYKEVKSKFVCLPLVSANKLLVPKRVKVKDKLQLLVTLNKWMFEDDPFLLEHIVRLAGLDNCEVTVLITTSVNRELRKTMQQLQQDYGIKTRTLNYYSQLSYVVSEYDLAFVTDTRYSCGAKLSAMYPSGTPMAAYRIPPVTSYISNLSTGYLLNCALDTTNNPVGKVYDSSHIHGLSKIIQQKDLNVISRNIHTTYSSMQQKFKEQLNGIMA